MANADAPFGLRPLRYKSGAPYNGACNTYYVQAADTTALFIGDPVTLAGSGDANGVADITRAAAGDRVTGVVVGFGPQVLAAAGSSTAIDTGYRVASTADYVLVADDPDLLFECQEDSVGGALAVTNIGNNVDFVAAAGSTVTKRSGYEIDSSTAATTAAGLRLVGLSDRAENEIGDNANWLVSIVETTQSPAAGTTGV